MITANKTSTRIRFKSVASKNVNTKIVDKDGITRSVDGGVIIINVEKGVNTRIEAANTRIVDMDINTRTVNIEVNKDHSR